MKNGRQDYTELPERSENICNSTDIIITGYTRRQHIKLFVLLRLIVMSV